jgi:hypothetical protein
MLRRWCESVASESFRSLELPANTGHSQLKHMQLMLLLSWFAMHNARPHALLLYTSVWKK